MTADLKSPVEYAFDALVGCMVDCWDCWLVKVQMKRRKVVLGNSIDCDANK